MYVCVCVCVCVCVVTESHTGEAAATRLTLCCTWLKTSSWDNTDAHSYGKCVSLINSVRHVCGVSLAWLSLYK